MTTFEVRQQVRSVHKSWLEKIFDSSSERVARLCYESHVEKYPSEYFELVKVTHTEECLAFTPKKGGE